MCCNAHSQPLSHRRSADAASALGVLTQTNPTAATSKIAPPPAAQEPLPKEALPPCNRTSIDQLTTSDVDAPQPAAAVLLLVRDEMITQSAALAAAAPLGHHGVIASRSLVLAVLLVGSSVQQAVQLRLVGHLHLDHPASAIGVGVDLHTSDACDETKGLSLTGDAFASASAAHASWLPAALLLRHTSSG